MLSCTDVFLGPEAAGSLAEGPGAGASQERTCAAEGIAAKAQNEAKDPEAKNPGTADCGSESSTT